jgi:hypothetical protein
MNSETGSAMYEYLWIISKNHIRVFCSPRACYCKQMPGNGILEILAGGVNSGVYSIILEEVTDALPLSLSLYRFCFRPYYLLCYFSASFSGHYDMIVIS